jgi:Flp pilus assembly protein TadG
MTGRTRVSPGRFASLRGFRGDRRGVAAIEFALVLPVMLLLALGCFEVPRFVMVYQKMERTSSGVGDLVAQADEPLTQNQMNDIFTAGGLMMSPFNLTTNGEVIVSSINNPNGAGVIMTWQQTFGTLGQASKFGAKGSNPSGLLPAGLAPTSNLEVLTTEVYFNYTPVLGNVIYRGTRLYTSSFSRPRNHNLMTCPAATAGC